MNAPEPLVPCLPDNAPFTPEQRAYLNGFLAGLFSRTPLTPPAPHPTTSAAILVPLSILFGSQTGTAESLAKRAAREASKRGFTPTVHDMATYPPAQLASEQRVLVITSTYGDGDPPDNAKSFGNFLRETKSELSQVRFSVCALGDSNYPKFCAFGQEVDSRLATLGAQRLQARADCDVDLETPFTNWLDAVLLKMKAPQAETITPSATLNITTPITLPEPSKYSRANPFGATLLTNRKLNSPGSTKDTRHFEFALKGSGLNYAAGDALGVLPLNCPDLVDEILRALACTGEEAVTGRDGTSVPLRESLLRNYEITRIPQPLLSAMAVHSGDDALRKLTSPGVNGELSTFLHGREIIDLLHAHPTVKFTPTEFIGCLKKLQPRLYSISSSPKAHPGQVHLTIGVVRYESFARQRKGVCSTYLAERTPLHQPVPVFVHSNKNFRVPSDNNAPMIMVGPGTGIAPFRAFLEERRAIGATGKHWLFFGDQCHATDFLYREELETQLRNGSLSRLDTAFSRDQAEKVYVQHRMRKHAKELFAWLEAGAHFYVCGDAKRMAKDVDAALHQVIQSAGQHTADNAVQYVSRLKCEGRYQRDVY